MIFIPSLAVVGSLPKQIDSICLTAGNRILAGQAVNQLVQTVGVRKSVVSINDSDPCIEHGIYSGIRMFDLNKIPRSKI